MVFLVTMLMNFAVVGLALFVLRPMRRRAMERSSLRAGEFIFVFGVGRSGARASVNPESSFLRESKS